MWFRTFALVFFLSALGVSAQAAGLKIVEVPADAGGPALRVAEWTPCARPPAKIQLGPFALDAVRDCPVAGEKLPLIVVSHGFGGTYLGHHDTAETLADAGFVVVALNHPDDNAMNEARARDLTALIHRPDDVRRLIDFMLGPSADAAKIDPQRIGFFGFSRGGYTGLVLAGAIPDFRQLRADCQDPTGAACDPIRQTVLPVLPPSQDPRIKAFVIADPLASVFASAESLKDVSAPIQLWGSERGGDGVSPQDVAAIAHTLRLDGALHIVANSGHFAFLTVCPADLAKALPDLCTDSPGFDRAAFHRTLDAQALAFFRKNLTATGQL